MEPRLENGESDIARPPLPRHTAPADAPNVSSPTVYGNVYNPDVHSPDVVTPNVYAPSGITPGVFTPDVFTQPRIAACAIALAEAAAPAGAGGHWCAETAAQRAVAILRAAFTEENGESSIVLIRIFQTCVWESLTAQLRSFVLARMNGGVANGAMSTGTGAGVVVGAGAMDSAAFDGAPLAPGQVADSPYLGPLGSQGADSQNSVPPHFLTTSAVPASTPCLALLATAGDRPSWADRRASHNHQALPLNGPEVLERAPLALTVLGDLVGRSNALRDPHGTTQLAVHPIPRAAGSPLVPAQWLLQQHGVTSALGLGGLLPTGEAFTAVLYTRAPLPATAASDFAPIAESLHTLLAPLAAAPLFEPAGPVGRVLPHEDEHRSAGPSGNPTVAGKPPVQRYSPGAAGSQGTWSSGRDDRWDDKWGDGWPVKPRPSVEAALRDHRTRLAQESRIIETLYSVGQTLAKQLDLGKLVHCAIEAATSVVGARFGAFFYTVREADGLSQTKYALAGLPPDSFDQFPLPRGAELLSSGALISSSIRVADVTEARHGSGGVYPAQPYGAQSYGGQAFGGQAFGAQPGAAQPYPVQSYTGLPSAAGSYPAQSYTAQPYSSTGPGNPPVRSYLAVPVTAANGEILGSFYFGHPDPGVFTERDEQLAKGVAAHAASAMDNARLYRREHATAMALQQSLLPTTPAQVGDLDVASSYLPGEQGSRVGGDWFDVIALSADRVALVIGDVMGRGIEAAAVMGQLRAAIQAYAVMDLPPAQILDQLNRLVCQLPIDQIATCVYAVFDPSEGTVRWSNAGHLPPLLTTPDGRVTLLEADLGMPLGVDQAVFAEAVRPLPAGSRLLLYTDGLVECRDQSLADRLGELREVLTELSAPGVVVGAQESCKHLINTLLTGAEHDDVAVLLITVQPAQTKTARLDLAPTLEAARIARGFIRSTLTGWQAEDFLDPVISVASELVNNAAEHAGTPLVLCLRQRDRSILIEVSDGDGRLVRPTPADLNDERHRGLVIVSTLANRWGVRPTDSGKTVWAEMTAALT